MSDAYLRMVFAQASEEMILAYQGKSGKLPRDWKMSREDEYIAGVWARLYVAVRDSEGGLAVLQEIELLRRRVEELEHQVDSLSRLGPRPEVKA